MAVLKARFAGGHIEVTTPSLGRNESERVVDVVMPANTAQKFPDEARAFAVALFEAAADAERPEPAEWP